MNILLYYIRLIFLCALACACAAEAASDATACNGLDPSKELYQYSHRIWQKKDGLPQNSVHAIVQTRDGYLWFATDEGLARFDGLQFRIFNVRNTPQFRSNQVRSLCETHDGTLWIGFAEGGIVSLKSQVFTPFTKEPAFTKASIWTMFEDHSHALWCASSNGLLKFNPADSSHTLFTSLKDAPYKLATSVAEDTSGTILISTHAGLTMLTGAGFRLHPAVQYPVRALYRDHAGTIWFSSVKEGISHLNRDSTVTHYGKEEGITAPAVSSIYEDRAGTLWIATAGNGLYRFAGGKFSSMNVADGLSSAFTESLLEDREGNLWIGTEGGGLNRLANTKFTTFLPSSGAAMVWSVYVDRAGTVWAGNESGSLLKLDHGKLVPVFTNWTFKGMAVMSILVDRTGVLWIGTRNGLYRIMRWHQSTLSRGDYTFYDSGMVNAITQDSSGVVWIGSVRGLLKYEHNAFHTFTKDDGLSGSDVRVVHPDRKGDLWLCTSMGGVTRMHDGRFIVYTPQKTNAPEHAMSMLEDSSGTLWFGTLAGGLVRWNGEKFSTIRYAHNLFDETIFSIQEDHLGNLWMSCNNGVFRVATKELNEACDGTLASLHCTSYGMSDGMKSDECNGGFQNSGCTTADGSMWFPTTLGLVMANPGSLPLNRVPPSIVIESFRADNQAVDLSRDIQIDPGAGLLEFTFTGLSFAAADRVHFKVLLEGFETTWTDVGTRRFVSYTNIPPGTYRFHVIAANNDGIWNDTGATVAFTLRPHFTQTAWFYLLCVGLIALSGAVTHKFYRRSKDRMLIQSRRQAQLEARLKESQLNSLSMQLQPHFLFNTLNSISSLMHFDVEKADTMVAHLGDLLRISLGRIKKQEVPLRQELEFLESYLCIEQARLDNRLCVVKHIDAETLSALVPSMLWQPLVENAIKHGIAPRKTRGTLNLGARRLGSELELTIQDDGEGMDRDFSPAASNGVGIRNTKERLELLYPHRHEIRFANNPDGGVTVTLRIPFRIEEYETDERQ